MMNGSGRNGASLAAWGAGGQGAGEVGRKWAELERRMREQRLAEESGAAGGAARVTEVPRTAGVREMTRSLGNAAEPWQEGTGAPGAGTRLFPGAAKPGAWQVAGKREAVPPMRAYEEEWNELRPVVKNPWHTLSEEELKRLMPQAAGDDLVVKLPARQIRDVPSPEELMPDMEAAALRELRGPTSGTLYRLLGGEKHRRSGTSQGRAQAEATAPEAAGVREAIPAMSPALPGTAPAGTDEPRTARRWPGSFGKSRAMMIHGPIAGAGMPSGSQDGQPWAEGQVLKPDDYSAHREPMFMDERVPGAKPEGRGWPSKPGDNVPGAAEWQPALARPSDALPPMHPLSQATAGAAVMLTSAAGGRRGEEREAGTVETRDRQPPGVRSFTEDFHGQKRERLEVTGDWRKEDVQSLFDRPEFQKAEPLERARAVNEVLNRAYQEWSSRPGFDAKAYREWVQWSLLARQRLDDRHTFGEKAGQFSEDLVTGIVRPIISFGADLSPMEFEDGSGRVPGKNILEHSGYWSEKTEDSIQRGLAGSQAEQPINDLLTRFKEQLDQGTLPMGDPAAMATWFKAYDAALKSAQSDWYKAVQGPDKEGAERRAGQLSLDEYVQKNGLLSPANMALLQQYQSTRDHAIWQALEASLKRTPQRAATEAAQADSLAKDKMVKYLTEHMEGGDYAEHMQSAGNPLELLANFVPVGRGYLAVAKGSRRFMQALGKLAASGASGLALEMANFAVENPDATWADYENLALQSFLTSVGLHAAGATAGKATQAVDPVLDRIANAAGDKVGQVAGRIQEEIARRRMPAPSVDRVPPPLWQGNIGLDSRGRMTHAAIHGRNADGSYRVSIQGKPPVHLSEADAAALSGMSPEKLHSQAQAREKAQQAEADAQKDANDPAAKTEETDGGDEETKVQGAARFDQVPNMDIWNDNPDGAVRTEDDSKQIYRNNIVKVHPFMEETFDILEKVTFRVESPEAMGGKWAAYEPAQRKSHYKWNDFFDNGRIVIRIDERVMKSDQAVLGIIAHELYELNAIRKKLGNNPISAADLQRFINDIHSTGVKIQNQSVKHLQDAK